MTAPLASQVAGRPGTHRVLARRIARLLLPPALAAGGWVSTELRVRLPDGQTARPDCCLALGEPPADGLLAVAPELVVRLGDPVPAVRWLAAGARLVWSVHTGGIEVQAAGEPARPAGDVLRAAFLPALALAADEVLASIR